MKAWLGLVSDDPLVPCLCKPTWRRIMRHIGNRNRPMKKYRKR